MIGAPLLAVRFGNAGMLAWIAAASLPLLLHLWQRRARHETPWAAVRFLRAALEAQRRTLRLQQIGLLVLRMLLPITLAVALADPQWPAPAGGQLASPSRARHYLLVVDTSASMAAEVGGQSRLQAAQAALRSRLAGAQGGDGFTLLTLANPPRAVVGEVTFSRPDLLSQLEALRRDDTAADLTRTAELVRETLARAGRQYPHLAPHVLWVSDFGANTWKADARALLEERAGAQGGAAWEILDVSAPVSFNRRIVTATRDNSAGAVATPVHWQVQVQVRGQPTATGEVHLDVNGERIATQVVPPTSGTHLLAFAHRFARPGDHRVRFSLAPDAFSPDDVHHEICRVRDRIEVLCVEGVPGAGRYVSHALAAGRDQLVRVRSLAAWELTDASLQEVDVLVLCNVAQFSNRQAQAIRQHLQRGRGVLCFLGDRVRATNYNRMWGAPTDAQARGDEGLPAQLVDVQNVDETTFAPHSYAHPVLAPFRDQPGTGLLTTPIWSYWRATAHPESEVVLSYASGDPAIISGSPWGGRFVLITCPASEQSRVQRAGRSIAWTAWHAWPSFVPMAQELLGTALASDEVGRHHPLGAVVSFHLPPQTPSTVRVTREGGGSWQIATTATTPPQLHFHETQRAGFYAVDTGLNAPLHFAIARSHPAESQAETASLAALQAGGKAPPAPRPDTENPASEHRTAMTLLGLLVFLLVVESVVSRHGGSAR